MAKKSPTNITLRSAGILLIILLLGAILTSAWTRTRRDVDRQVTGIPAPQHKDVHIPLPRVKAEEGIELLNPATKEFLADWDGQIRVEITPKDLKHCLTVNNGTIIYAGDSGTVTERFSAIDQGSIAIENDQLIVRSDMVNFTSRLVEHVSGEGRLGKIQALIEINPDVDGSLWIGDRCYRGRIRIVAGRRSIQVINVLGLEDYLASVIDSEMPADFPIAARQAQAIIARSYAFAHILDASPAATFDVTDSTRHQMYLGYQYRHKEKTYAGETRSGRATIESTRGIVCRAGAEILMTFFSAVCGGHGNEVLEMVRGHEQFYPQHGCQYCRGAPRFQWRVELQPPEACRLLKEAYPKATTFDTIRFVRSQKKTDTLNLNSFVIGENNKHQSLYTASMLKQAWRDAGMQSLFFDVRLNEELVLVRGEGHGHGVGFCQWGSRGLAFQEKNATQIISFYFPDIHLIELTDKAQQE